jgi:beta-galactosidase
MDAGWRFALGNATDTRKDFNFATVPFTFAKAGYGDGPSSPKFDDRAWRVLDLPHDWAVELPFDSHGDGNHGSKAIGRNFPENSIGWYRKTFTVPKEDLGRRLGIDFDGVYRDSMVWVNGFYLGNEHSGYESFHYDLTNYLNYGGTNVIVVRADATREEGWFYEGAGIYRHVWLTKTAPVHVAHDGTYVTTTIGDPSSKHPEAVVCARVTVQNDTYDAAAFSVEERIEDAAGKTVATAASGPQRVGSAGESDVSSAMTVKDAKLWSVESPVLHTLVTTVLRDGKVVDVYRTSFGIRSIRFDPDHGFFLNGKHVELKGTNLHQDHAGVGTGLPDGVMEYRVGRLKAMGSNAIRMSHNPPTPELLDACDRMGMLVIDENRMMGTTPEAEGQLTSMIVRDRNHPSVILWSVGNEEWDLEWSVFGERLTRETEALAKRLDPSRMSTVALSGSGAGNSLSTEVLGFNYYLQHDIDKIHARWPTRPVVGTEESSSEHTRGTYADDLEHQHLVAYDFEADGKHASVEDSWKFYVARPFAAGLFYWTGFDYRGETTPFEWPAISSQFGQLDTCGFFKDNAYLLQPWWTDVPMVHVLPHWTWPGKERQPIDVRVYSNARSVELMLNGKSLGRKEMPVNSHLEWKVPYEAGKLEARGFGADGKLVVSDRVETVTAAAKVELEPSAMEIAVDPEAVSIVTVSVKDAMGRIVPDSSNLVSFQVSGPGRILGVGNGDPASHEADKVVEGYRRVGVMDWRTRAADGEPSAAEVAPEFDDFGWAKATDPRWDEKRVYPAASVYRGSFTIPDDAAEAKLKLIVSSLGEGQMVYLNGVALGRDEAFDPVGYEFVLNAKMLRPGRNVVAVYAKRYSDEHKKLQSFQWGVAGPAAVQVVTPAPAWQRSVFHGLAQVIVESTGEAGEIRLTAMSPGLAAATVGVVARP